jgi:hypothetical protein
MYSSVIVADLKVYYVDLLPLSDTERIPVVVYVLLFG